MSPALFSGLGSHTLLELFVFLGIQMSVEVFEKHLSCTGACRKSLFTKVPIDKILFIRIEKLSKANLHG
jgi:hypothetical protein